MHAETFEGKGTGQRFRYRFKNKGRITAVGESHPTRSNATRAAKAIVRGILAGAGLVPVFYTIKPPARPGIVEIRWSIR